jgi:hypothetical protein
VPDGIPDASNAAAADIAADALITSSAVCAVRQDEFFKLNPGSDP